MIIRGRELTADFEDSADAVVVGTGAGGGMALRELSRAGLKVIALEEGGYHVPTDFTQREEKMIPMLFQDRGARTTADFAIRVLMGRGVGGSTIHNTNLCKRTPGEILDQWARRFAVVGCSERDLAPVFEEVERDLSVSEIPEPQQNANNQVLARGVKALGFRGGPLRHNRVGCRESGFCELGCAYDAKQNVTKVLLPAAMAANEQTVVMSDVRATRIIHRQGAVAGVAGTAMNAAGKPIANITLKAKIVVLAASAVGSAALALASDLPDPYGRLGRGLRLHPGAAVAGFFDQRIDGVYGIPQSYECTELLDFAEQSDRRAWITTAFAHPIGAAASLPGFGAAHMALLRRYAHMAVLTAMVHDETEGHVTLEDGDPKLHYGIGEGDRDQLIGGLRACARILFAAGAREVVLASIPALRLTKPAEVDRITADVVGPHKIPLLSVHPMGTLCLGEDPKTSVVKSTGEHHAIRGLFVLDGSLFPTSIGVPPQISIYAFSRHLAKHAVERARG
ncbi:MAG TPA: GMC family oxidoreductase [Polyangiaceae bacterium]|nr:GMC family oxidoreductase [Polyangiaceae bacterium]